MQIAARKIDGGLRMKNIEIKCDGKKTELFINGVKLEKGVSINSEWFSTLHSKSAKCISNATR